MIYGKMESDDRPQARQRLMLSILLGSALLLAGCGGDDDAPTPAPTPAPPGTLECPGTDTICSPTECCTGFAGSDNKTFPCPNMNRVDYGKCEGGESNLVDALLAAMTRDEKHRFLRGVGWENSWDAHKGYYIGNSALGQRFGIPSQNMQDSGNGFRNDRPTIETDLAKDVELVTSFPVALAIASIWSEEDMGRVGTALAKEFRAKGANVLLGPAVNVHRTPRNGRNAEYMSGESPYLGARLVKPYIRSVQEGRVLSSVKHFINNNQETCRKTSNSIVDDRTRWEMYYPPFIAAVQADVAIQMCGYNFVNGVQNCASQEILKNDLKVKVGFKGWIQSDWWALKSFAPSDFIDQEMPGTAWPGGSNYFTDANLATLSLDKVNAMVSPQLTMMVRYGLLEESDDTCQFPNCNSKLYEKIVTTPESQELSRELATKAVTMLKNEKKALPLLSKTGTKIALLGSACALQADLTEQLKDWKNRNYYHIGGSGRIITKKPVTIEQGLKEACPTCTFVTDFTDNTASSISAAAGQDVVILCGGVTSSEEIDRENLLIEEDQFFIDVSKAASLVSIPKVALTMTAGTIVTPWVDNFDALLNVFLPGKYAGNAFADVIFGISNPSAKSPVSYPMVEEGTITPCACDADKEQNDCTYSEGLFIAWYNMEPADVRFPFGHGLSYSTFGYGELQAKVSNVMTECPDQEEGVGDAIVCVQAKVTNSADVAGVEVAQLYLGFPAAANEPPKLLRGFHRLPELKKDEVATAKFPLYERDFQIYSATAGKWERPAGEFTIYVGTSSGDTPLTTKLTPPVAATFLDINV